MASEIDSTGAEGLGNLFAAAREDGRTVLLPYMTAGLPTLDASVRLFEAMAAAGADGFEVGIPYADPLMDGPVIMEAGERALAAGTTVDGCLEVVSDVVSSTGLPVIVMTYVNPVLRMGVDRFCVRLADVGAAGLIVADLPVDEAGPFLEATRTHGVGLVLFAAPTTDERRLRAVAMAEPAFVYAVADMGVTGTRDEASDKIAGLAARIRDVSAQPIVAGVGISTPDHARAAARHVDGVIVGSALVRLVLEANDADDSARALRSAVAAFAAAVGD